jgi:hypothetical protein
MSTIKFIMKKKTDKSKKKDPKKESSGYKKWEDEDKNRAGNDVASEIKIANAGGSLEGGENKQWHMDQGEFDEQEKKDFENNEQKD